VVIACYEKPVVENKSVRKRGIGARASGVYLSPNDIFFVNFSYLCAAIRKN